MLKSSNSPTVSLPFFPKSSFSKVPIENSSKFWDVLAVFHARRSKNEMLVFWAEQSYDFAPIFVEIDVFLDVRIGIAFKWWVIGDD